MPELAVEQPKGSEWLPFKQLETGELEIQGTGLNTNPRRFESLYGFVSAPVQSLGAAGVPLWAVGLACVNNPSKVPANGRTAGNTTTIYTLIIHNPTAAAIDAWLEIGGVAITPLIPVAAVDAVVIDFPAGMCVGDQDVDFNSTVALVIGQIMGTEA